MNWRNRLLLGSAAALMAVTGGQAADLPVKAKPVEYVKICSAYGAGFYFIPGTDICLRVGGYAYAETGWNGRSAVPLLYSGNIGQNLLVTDDDNRINFRVRGVAILDARSQTPIGTLRTYIAFGADYNNNQNGVGPGGNVTPYLERAFLQFAGFTAGYTASFFDFGGWYSPFTLSSIAYHWTPLFAYTARLGDGFSATISIEDGQGIRTKVISNAQAFTGFQTATFNGYGGQEVPDIVANLRADGVWGSAQISGALHKVRLNQALHDGTAPITVGPQGDLWGYAILGGIEIKTPMIAPGDSIILQGVYAKGAIEHTGISASASGFATTIGRKNALGIGPGADIYDAACIGAPFGCELSTAWSANLFFRHFWQPNLRSGFWVGYNQYRPGWSGTANPAFNASPDLRIWQAGGNVIWSPARTLDLSLDVLWSRVETASCAGSALAASTCNLTADIWTVWTRWRRNF